MSIRSPYLEWIKALEFPQYNIGMSGMYYTGTAADLGIDSSDLPVNARGMYGLESFIDALSGRYNIPVENIFVSQGTSSVNYQIFKALFVPGDEALIETPVYDPLPAAIQAVGARPVFLPRVFEDNFQIREEVVQKLLSPKTKALLVTNLHNPSGILIPDEKLQSLARLLGNSGSYLIVDEVYLEFYFGKKNTYFHLAENIITTSSLTKAFGLGGLRAGWSFAPAAVVEKARRIYNLVVGSGPGITEYIASKIISDDALYNRFADIAEEIIAINLPIVEEFIESRRELKWVKPDGGIVCFPYLENSEMVDNLYNILYRELDTLIMPGKFFSAPPAFRLGFGIPSDILRKGLKNLGTVLDSISFHLTGKG